MPRRSEINLLFNGRPKSCQTVVGHQGPPVPKGPFPWQASKAANKRPAQGVALSNLLRMARKFVPAAALKKPGIFPPRVADAPFIGQDFRLMAVTAPHPTSLLAGPNPSCRHDCLNILSYFIPQNRVDPRRELGCVTTEPVNRSLRKNLRKQWQRRGN